MSQNISFRGLEWQIVCASTFWSRLLGRRERSGSSRSGCGLHRLLRGERSSTNRSGTNGSAGYGSTSHRGYTVKHVECTDIIKPPTVELMGINIKLDSHILTVLNVELTDTILAEYAEHATLGILTGNFDDIILRHPRVARTG